MGLRLRVCSVALFACLQPGAAVAGNDWYASFALGSDYANNARLENSGLRADFDQGWPMGGAAIGTRLFDGLHAELELMYRANDFEVVYSQGSDIEINPDPDDKISSTSVMANLWYEFLPNSGMRPFLGAGLGRTRINYRVSDDDTEVGIIDDRTDALAYQFIAGFNLTISPRLDLAVSYRHWRTETFDLETATGADDKSRQTVHSTLLGVRYLLTPRTFNEAPGVSRPKARRGLYLSASAGAGYAQDSEIKDNLANFDAFGPGPFAAIAVGYGFERKWRVELEMSARRNDLKLIDFNPALGEARADGDIRIRSLMVNLFHDFLGFRGFQPHLGAGFGATRGTYDLRVRGATYVDDEDTAIAGQLMVGATSQITERAAVTVGYRAWMGGQFQMTQPDGRPLKTDQIIHSLHVGLRYDLPSPGP